MKNRSNYLYLMATLLLAGCSADEALDEGGRTPISFGNTVVQTVETRAATNLNEGFLTEGEAVTVKISKTGVGSYTDYTYVASNDEGQMTLKGSTTPYYPGDGSNVDIRAYYPSTAGGSFTVSNDQTTDANYKASDLMFASVSDQARSTSAINLAFAHQMAKIIVNTTAAEGSGITITGITLKNIKPTVTFTPAATDVADVVGAASGEAVDITMTNNGAALIPAQAVDGNFLVITTSAGNATYSLTKTFAAGHQYTINLTVSSAEIGTTTAITGWSDGGTGSTNSKTDNAPAGAKAIDIGLYVGGASSGTKLLWANMNVGATMEAGYGTYFAWGETSGYTVNEVTNADNITTNYKTLFDWYTYAWSNGSNNQLSKYCPTGQESHWDNHINSNYPDNKTQLEPGDDAAHANWGGSWRMATPEEMTALKNTFNTGDDTNWKWEWKTNYNSVTGCNGWLITYKGIVPNTSIFLPVAGYRTSIFYERGSIGYYWSSSLNPSSPHCAYSLLINNSSASVPDNYARIFGFTIRAVKEE